MHKQDTHFLSQGQPAERTPLREVTQVRASHATTVELFPQATKPQTPEK